MGDGRPQEESRVNMAASRVRDIGRLAMVAVGLGKDEAYMKSLVSQPQDENYYPVEAFDRLSDNFVDELTKDVCKTPSPTPPPAPPTPPPGSPTPPPTPL